MKRAFSIIFIGLLVATLVAACAPIPEPVAKPTPPAANMPNPASVNCEKQGGTLEIRKEAAGEVGYCKFSDGSECEEWALLRGECKPGK
jgi:putative hemolysin